MGEHALTGGVATWAEWRQIYELIVADFGFDPSADRAARDALATLAGPRALAFDELPNLAGRTAAVVAPAPGLASAIDAVDETHTIIAASSAAATLAAAGVRVDIIVTDLDGTPETAADLSERGTPVAIHGHGDNRSLLREWVPAITPEQRFPTTQVRPIERVANVGGFTDGDRAAFLATALGAERVVFHGWDFDDPTVGVGKRRKLRWAERLLAWLESRRGDRFAVLDGRREEIDLSGLPRAERGP